ncbi:hypothetical protein MIND_01221400 [Mycena indigotica]|uniref:Uncharacterized protein n=1 Tax=Mycena indigotica TaxID=2126181 RepID=A0A8H6S3E1_9AGAR|nr:uncharacterized protein MIND_01221400 [Mycena indigotica]KAF7291958.1 hypothetical protein MIND_01221400 [Mycena indigotica]
MDDADVLDWDEDDGHTGPIGAEDDDDAVSLGSIHEEEEIQSEPAGDSQPDPPPVSKPPSPEPLAEKPQRSPSPHRGRGERQRSHRDRKPNKTPLTQPITHALPPKPISATLAFSYSSTTSATLMASSLKDSQDNKTKQATNGPGTSPSNKPSSAYREREPSSSDREIKLPNRHASPPSPISQVASRAAAPQPKGTWDRPRGEDRSKDRDRHLHAVDDRERPIRGHQARDEPSKYSTREREREGRERGPEKERPQDRHRDKVSASGEDSAMSYQDRHYRPKDSDQTDLGYVTNDSDRHIHSVGPVGPHRGRSEREYPDNIAAGSSERERNRGDREHVPPQNSSYLDDGGRRSYPGADGRGRERDSGYRRESDNGWPSRDRPSQAFDSSTSRKPQDLDLRNSNGPSTTNNLRDMPPLRDDTIGRPLPKHHRERDQTRTTDAPPRNPRRRSNSRSPSRERHQEHRGPREKWGPPRPPPPPPLPESQRGHERATRFSPNMVTQTLPPMNADNRPEFTKPSQNDIDAFVPDEFLEDNKARERESGNQAVGIRMDIDQDKHDEPSFRPKRQPLPSQDQIFQESGPPRVPPHSFGSAPRFGQSGPPSGPRYSRGGGVNGETRSLHWERERDPVRERDRERPPSMHADVDMPPPPPPGPSSASTQPPLRNGSTLYHDRDSASTSANEAPRGPRAMNSSAPPINEGPIGYGSNRGRRSPPPFGARGMGRGGLRARVVPPPSMSTGPSVTNSSRPPMDNTPQQESQSAGRFGASSGYGFNSEPGFPDMNLRGRSRGRGRGRGRGDSGHGGYSRDTFPGSGPDSIPNRYNQAPISTRSKEAYEEPSSFDDDGRRSSYSEGVNFPPTSTRGPPQRSSNWEHNRQDRSRRDDDSARYPEGDQSRSRANLEDRMSHSERYERSASQPSKSPQSSRHPLPMNPMRPHAPPSPGRVYPTDFERNGRRGSVDADRTTMGQNEGPLLDRVGGYDDPRQSKAPIRIRRPGPDSALYMDTPSDTLPPPPPERRQRISLLDRIALSNTLSERVQAIPAKREWADVDGPDSADEEEEDGSGKRKKKNIKPKRKKLSM